MIGDPSGRSAERNLLDVRDARGNVASIRAQLERFLDFTPGAAAPMLVNNLDWLGELSLIEFLRDTGKHFTVPYMLAKDSVQVRLERGLSFTEFSYMHTPGVRLLAPPSDDGRRAADGRCRPVGQHHRRSGAHPPDGRGSMRRPRSSPRTAWPTSCCCRRRARSSGRARRASRSGWTRRRTTPYAFYQYWLNTDDRDVGTYLRWFTEFGREQIEALEAEAADRRRRARPSERSPATSRPARTARRRPRGPRPTARRCSPAGRSRIPRVLASLFESTRRVHVPRRSARGGARGRCSPLPACSPRGARRAA